MDGWRIVVKGMLYDVITSPQNVFWGTAILLEAFSMWLATLLQDLIKFICECLKIFKTLQKSYICTGNSYLIMKGYNYNNSAIICVVFISNLFWILLLKSTTLLYPWRRDLFSGECYSYCRFFSPSFDMYEL